MEYGFWVKRIEIIPWSTSGLGRFELKHFGLSVKFLLFSPDVGIKLFFNPVFKFKIFFVQRIWDFKLKKLNHVYLVIF